MASEGEKKAELDRRKNKRRTGDAPIGGQTEQGRTMSASSTDRNVAILSELPPRSQLAYVQNRRRVQGSSLTKKVAKKIIKKVLISIAIPIALFILPWVLIAGAIFLIVVLLGNAVGIW